MGLMGILLGELRYCQRHPDPVGANGNKRWWFTMPHAVRDADVLYFQLPRRLYDGSMASVGLVLSHVWDRSATKDSHHRSAYRWWRHDVCSNK